VLPDHQQKIDLHQEYPCPCHRQGRLQEITLTEAFGCDRCQKIFVLQEQGHRIEELSTIYPYKSCYFWDGRRWKSVKSSSRDLVWTMLTIGLLLSLAIAFFPVYFGSSRILQVLLTSIAILILIVTIVWLMGQS
jgi:hypothetical protein